MFLSFLSLVGLVIACADNDPAHHTGDGHAHAHVHEQREHFQFPLTLQNPSAPLTPPYRSLDWGDFNVIHTTDTHGWLLGHHKPTWPEPNYTGDLGDFASFVKHMRRIAASDKDADLLLVDSGDLHDGTGLSDGYPPGGVDGNRTNEFIARLQYDVMSIGNHELYDYSVAYDMHTNFVHHLNGTSYLSSNAYITVFNSNHEAVSVPIGNRSATFKTRKGRKVTSLGPIFDLKRHSKNTTLHTVADMVTEDWFIEAIKEEPDVFLLVGHIPVSNDSWPVVVGAIRGVHPYTPILIFGGHSHKRDCQQYDGRSMALQSGQYMETIGWMSAELDAAKGNTNDIKFSRRYLDQNRVTYQYHTGTNDSTFDTPDGLSISSGLRQLATEFNLDYCYGTAPQDYFLRQVSYPSSGHVLQLFTAEAAPFVFAMNNSHSGNPNLIIIDSGVLRYDAFKGRFTKNDQLTASSYSDKFLFIPNIKAGIANQVLPALNKGNSSTRFELENELWDNGDDKCNHSWVEDMSKHQAAPATGTDDLTLGYVTTDNCTDLYYGDDTKHIQLLECEFPKYVGSNPPKVSDDAPIDLVFVDFIQDTVRDILNTVQNETHYTPADVSLYTETLSNQVLGLYAQAKWNKCPDRVTRL